MVLKVNIFQHLGRDLVRQPTQQCVITGKSPLEGEVSTIRRSPRVVVVVVVFVVVPIVLNGIYLMIMVDATAS